MPLHPHQQFGSSIMIQALLVLVRVHLFPNDRFANIKLFFVVIVSGRHAGLSS